MYHGNIRIQEKLDDGYLGTLCYLYNFSVNLKFFQNKKFTRLGVMAHACNPDQPG